MKRLFVLFASIAALAGCLELWAEAGVAQTEKPLRVAVFVGNGARNCGVFRWLELTTRSKEMEAYPVDGDTVRSGALDSADILVMPGGWSPEEAKTLGAEGREKLRRFIWEGGGYVGTCAGCCLLMQPSKSRPNFLGILPYTFAPSGGKADMSILFNEHAESLAGIKKGKEVVRYSGGPVLIPATNAVEGADFKIVATYNSDINALSSQPRESMAGRGCAVAGTYGKGRVFAFSVHPEVDQDDHDLLKGAFRYVSGGRTVDWNYPQRKRGQLAVGFMSDASFGIETAKLVQKLVTDGEFDVKPLNRDIVAAGGLHHVDAVLLPDSAKKNNGALFKGNKKRTEEFIARGGKVVAWGAGSKTAKKSGVEGIAYVKNGAEALEALREFAKSPVPAPKPFPAKVAKPIKVAFYCDRGGNNRPIAEALSLSPEYEVKVLRASDYASGALDGFDMVLQPGGGGRRQYRALGEKGVAALKKFVWDGGKYYGVCAGAFLALQQTHKDYPRIGLVPFKADKTSHYRGGAPIKIGLTEEGRRVFKDSKPERKTEYHGGPALVDGDPIKDADVKVLAKYVGRIMNTDHPEPIEPMCGKGVLVGGNVGKGRIFLSCSHPEKEEHTFDLVRRGIEFLTGVYPTPVYADRVRGAVSVMYFAKYRNLSQFYFDQLLRDRRIDVLPSDWNNLPHADAVVLVDKVLPKTVERMNSFIARGGRVVVVCDTPDKAKAAAGIKGATTVANTDGVIEAILRK